MQNDERESDVRGEIERLVRPLLQTFDEGDLVRLAVDEEEFALEVVRRNRPRAVTTGSEGMTGIAAADLAGGAPQAPERPMELVTSDVVGVFRGSRPAVVIGERVAASRELGYVEALGIRNPVRAGRGGAIAAIMVEEGEPVEYGQPLFGFEGGE
ncbi:MAG: hypothetical protein KGM44_11810 [bacterium]|nr:hypothetical protein [bacterium]